MNDSLFFMVFWLSFDSTDIVVVAPWSLFLCAIHKNCLVQKTNKNQIFHVVTCDKVVTYTRNKAVFIDLFD